MILLLYLEACSVVGSVVHLIIFSINTKQLFIWDVVFVTCTGCVKRGLHLYLGFCDLVHVNDICLLSSLTTSLLPPLKLADEFLR